MSIDVTALKYFRAVAKLGSFSRAAEKLNVSQSAISRQVKLLEEDLRTELFDRTSRGVDVTPAGEVLLERAEQLLQLVDELKRDVAEATSVEDNQLGVGFPTSLGRLLISPVITELSARRPSTRFSLFEGFSDEVTSLVGQKHLNVGIVSKPAQNEVLVTTPVFKEQMWLISMPDAFPFHGPVVPSQLAGIPLVGTRLVGSMVTNWLSEHGVTPGRITETDSKATLFDLAFARIGYIVGPRSALLDEMRDGRLTGSPIAGLFLPRLLVERRDVRRSAISEFFIDQLLNRVSELIEGDERLLDPI